MRMKVPAAGGFLQCEVQQKRAREVTCISVVTLRCNRSVKDGWSRSESRP